MLIVRQIHTAVLGHVELQQQTMEKVRSPIWKFSAATSRGRSI